MRSLISTSGMLALCGSVLIGIGPTARSASSTQAARGVLSKQLDDHRAPVPDGAAIAQARSEYLLRVFEVSADEPIGKSRAKELSAQALIIARAPDVAPTPRYAVLELAHEWATSAKDVEKAFEALSELESNFVLDVTLRRVAAVEAIAANSTGSDRRRNAEFGMQLAEDLLDCGALELALRVIDAISIGVKKSEDEALTERWHAANDALADFREVKPAFDKLAEDPSDPEANLAVGLYLCFRLEEFDRGLPYVLLGPDEALEAVAQADLQRPSEPAAQLALAEAWDAYAQAAPKSRRCGAWCRALHWFRKARPGLEGTDVARAIRSIELIDKRDCGCSGQMSDLAESDGATPKSATGGAEGEQPENATVDDANPKRPVRRQRPRQASLPSDSRKAVELALAWLARHQSADGSWDCDEFMRNSAACTGECDYGGESLHDVGVTGLALRAFMGHGNSTVDGKYQANVSRGVQWLLDQMDPDSGLIGERIGPAFLYDHAIATAAIATAYRSAKNDEIGESIQLAVKLIINSQVPYGGWRYDSPGTDTDTSVTGWMVQALKAAEGAGVSVDPVVYDHALAWINEVTDPATGRCGYDSIGSTSARIDGVNDHFLVDRGEAMTGVAIYVRSALGQKVTDTPILAKHIELLSRRLPLWDADGFGCDMYYWYYGSVGMSHAPKKDREKWFRAVREALVGNQVQAGEARGSWNPVGPWGWSGGRIYSTAICALALLAEG